MARSNLKVFTGSAHPELAQEISEFLCVAPGQARLQRFPDTEVSFQIDENIRGTDVFIVQPTSRPVDANIMELCVMIDAFRRSSASRITAVIPYYGYGRSDKKDRPRVPISAKLVANLITVGGADRLLTIDLHAAQIQGFFDIPVDHLYAAPVFINYCQEHTLPNLTVVAPDTGGAERARAYAKRLDAELALCDKRREKANVAEVMNVVGDVRGRNCLIVDDMCDTGGSLTKVARALKEAGAERVHACFTHPVLSGRACELLANSDIEKIIVTNTIPLRDDASGLDKIKVLSIAPLLAKAIKSIHEETSVSSLFV
jgi:ribose-phosphate pyrophosphokinase